MSFFKTPLMTLLTSLFFYMLRPTSGDCLPRPVFSWTSPNDLTDILVFLRRYCAPFLQTVCRYMSFLGPPLMTSLTSLFFYLLRPVSGDCLPRHFFSWISDYIFVLSCGAAGNEPDPTDRAVSKRAWEESMKAWRRELAALRRQIEREEAAAAALGRGAADISAALSASAVPDRVQEVVDAFQSADQATSERAA
jgi:hypothetical protein